MTYDWSRVSRATAERVMFALDTYCGTGTVGFSRQVGEALTAARAEACPPLRTRAEVDAEIANEVRRLPLPDKLTGEVIVSGIAVQRLLALRAEETAPEAAPRRPKDSPVAQRELLKMWDATHADPDPCSCEEALGLRERIAQLEEMMRNRRIELVATFERALKAEARVRALETP